MDKNRFKLTLKKQGHSNLHSIDQYAYDSNLRDWNPTFKVVFSLLTLLFCMLANHMVISGLIIVTMFYLITVKGGVSSTNYCALLAIPLSFLVLGCLPIAFDFSLHPTGQMEIPIGKFYLYTTKAHLFVSLELFMKALGAVSAMYLMTLTTPMNELITVLKKAHMPRILIELMYFIYRYIFILTDVQRRMKESAQSRLGTCDFKTSCLTFGKVMGNLFVISLKKANDCYDAMEARGYEGDLCFLEQEGKVIEGKQMRYAILFFLLLSMIRVGLTLINF